MIIAPQNREVFIADVCMVGGGGKLVPPTIQTFVKFSVLRSHVFVRFQHITFKLGTSLILRCSSYSC